MKKETFILCILGKDTMRRIHWTKVKIQKENKYPTMKDRNSNNSRLTLRVQKVQKVNRKPHRMRKRLKTARVKLSIKRVT